MAERSERQLAVITSWGLFGSFAFCFVLSGFARADMLLGLAGFALFVAAFVTHVIVNWIFATDFSSGEAALGFVVFVIAALGFIASWLFDPHFTPVNLATGLIGFGALVASVVFYLFTKYGMRGSFTLFDHIRDL